MQFAEFAQYLAKLESLSPRLEMMAVLVEVFDKLEVAEVRPACYLLQGQLAPAYQTIDFQLSTKMILRALAQLSVVDSQNTSDTDATVDLFGQVTVQDSALVEVTKLYKQVGDIGQVAERVRQDLPIQDEGSANRSSIESTQTASVLQIHRQLLELAQESGSGSQERKLDRLVALLSKNDPLSAKYICRIIIGRLRLGFSTMTMLDSLSWLVAGDKSLTLSLEEAYQKRADLGELAALVIATHRSQQDVTTALSQFSVKVGVPVVPALCQRLNTAAEIVGKLHVVIAEPKYDGLRVQIHVWKEESNNAQEMLNQVQHVEVGTEHDEVGIQYGGVIAGDNEHIRNVRAFTRNLDDVSHMFPELIEATKVLQCQSCVLDSEAIGVDLDSGELKTFQETMTRKRKHNIAQATTAVPLRFYIFDILEKDGRPLIDLPLFDRKSILNDVLPDNSSDQLVKTTSITTTDSQELHAYHTQQLALGLEGMVAKAADSQYRPGRKGWRWVKIKEAEGTTGKLNDTLDVVVMGYYLGRGKRTQFGLGALLVGIIDFNEETGEPEVKSIAKIGTGMSEEQLVALKGVVASFISEDRPAEYCPVDKLLTPDVWVTPSLVIEVAADEITISPTHTAGFALRFPRLIKLRPDKSWQQATNLEELKQIALLSIGKE